MPIISGSSGKPTGAAGGDLGGTYPNPTVTSGAHLGANTVPVASLAAGTAGQVLGGTGPSYALPPGFEISYTQITSQVLVVSTTESTGTSIIAPGAITFDGTAVLCHFFSPEIGTGSATSVSDQVTISLFEGATQIGRMATVLIQDLASGQAIRSPCSAFLRFTPTAASHTYTITAFTNSTTGSPFVGAGAGSTGADVAAFLRFTKV